MLHSHRLLGGKRHISIGRRGSSVGEFIHAQNSVTCARTALLSGGPFPRDTVDKGRLLLLQEGCPSTKLKASLSTSSGIPRSGVQHINHILPVVYRPEAEASKAMAVQGDIYFATGNQNKLKEVWGLRYSWRNAIFESVY
jgi:hypothetical protein